MEVVFDSPGPARIILALTVIPLVLLVRGISIALAISLPEGPMRATILTTTYAVVLFSVIVQGGSIGWLIQRLSRRSA